MQNLLALSKKEIFPISLILVLALSRLIPHPPNITPIIAVAIMSSYLFKNLYFSLCALLISMILSDLFIGFYGNMVFVYFKVITQCCCLCGRSKSSYGFTLVFNAVN